MASRNNQTSTMKTVFVFVCVCLAAVLGARIRRAEEKYVTKYDNVDLDQILKSERLLKNYVNCLLEKGKCTPDGSELKRVLPDALEHKCSKCSETQQKGSEKVIRFLIEQRPEIFKELEKKYDPAGKYRADFRAEAEKRGLKIPE